MILVPPDGVDPVSGGGGSYGDRRMRDVVAVDYERPGFTVVYLEDEPSPGGRVEFTIRASEFGLRLEPEVDVVGVGGGNGLP